jgi:hypothetical protein
MKLINRLFILSVMMFSSLNIFAQITGKVVDSKTGNELIGANVYLEGNTRGTSTNISGEFSLDLNLQVTWLLVLSGMKL